MRENNEINITAQLESSNLDRYEWRERPESVHTLVHGAQHAGGKLVDGIGFLDQRNKGSNPALVVGRRAKVGKDELLELVNLILQVHQIRDRLVSNGYSPDATNCMS